jgi:putative addiction module CopG family antidote
MVAALSPELEKFVQSEVETGHFASREAVIEAALWDMQQRRAETPEIKELRRLLAESDEDFLTGRVRYFNSDAELRTLQEEIIARGRARPCPHPTCDPRRP